MSLIFALKGRQGDKGDKGDEGDKGDKGDKGDTGESGFFTSLCSVCLSADQSIPTGAWTKILFNTKLYDNDSEFDIVTHNRFIAKVAGVYHVTGQLRFIGLTSPKMIYAGIRKNDVVVKINQLVITTYDDMPVLVTGDVPLSVDDYIELWGLHDQGINRIVHKNNVYTYLDIHQFA